MRNALWLFFDLGNTLVNEETAAECRIQRRHCQLERPWYARRVGGRQFGSRISFDRLLCCPAQPERGRKRRSGSAKLTMRAPGDRQGVKSASLCQ
jgi:hypothetical protein